MRGFRGEARSRSPLVEESGDRYPFLIISLLPSPFFLTLFRWPLGLQVLDKIPQFF